MTHADDSSTPVLILSVQDRLEYCIDIFRRTARQEVGKEVEYISCEVVPVH